MLFPAHKAELTTGLPGVGSNWKHEGITEKTIYTNKSLEIIKVFGLKRVQIT